MAVACLHLVWVLGIRNICSEWFYLVAVNQLIVGLFVALHSCVRWELFDVEALLALFWHR